jgi:hypothetical protein
MKYFVWLTDALSRPELRQFLESHPQWFIRCDAYGNENPHGPYWAVRREHLVHEHGEEVAPLEEIA